VNEKKLRRDGVYEGSVELFADDKLLGQGILRAVRSTEMVRAGASWLEGLHVWKASLSADKLLLRDLFGVTILIRDSNGLEAVGFVSDSSGTVAFSSSVPFPIR